MYIDPRIGSKGVLIQKWSWFVSDLYAWWNFKYIFYVSPHLGEDEPILTHMFQMGLFNHQIIYMFGFLQYKKADSGRGIELFAGP